jgi:hypothetical protein
MNREALYMDKNVVMVKLKLLQFKAGWSDCSFFSFVVRFIWPSGISK